jgi:hypothetical protein
MKTRNYLKDILFGISVGDAIGVYLLSLKAENI